SRGGGRPGTAPAGFVDQAARDIRFHAAHLPAGARFQPIHSVRELAGGTGDLEGTARRAAIKSLNLEEADGTAKYADHAEPEWNGVDDRFTQRGNAIVH